MIRAARPSSYPYILGRALNEYRINISVTIYLIVYEALGFNRLTGLGVASAVNLLNHLSFIDYFMINTSCPLIIPILNTSGLITPTQLDGPR